LKGERVIDNDIPNELEKELSKNEIFKEYDNFMRTILLTDFENLNKPLYKELQTRAKSFLPKRKFYAAGTEI
jgi:hypothetical protein